VLAGESAPAYRLPCIVKPCNDGSSFGVTLAKTPAAYRRGLALALRGDGRALVEDYVPGREFTVGVVGQSALPVVEIVLGNEIYDFDSKYGKAGYQHLVPATLKQGQEKAMRSLGLRVHRLLGCRGFSRVDMIQGRGGLKVIEVNTLPGMTKDSLLPDAARAVGWDMQTLVVNMLNHSLKGQ
jgi:D-alanine-D-alanine ligase